MTRINVGIPPKNLTDQHLVTELRELPRVISAVEKRRERGRQMNDIPMIFSLGTGHMKFFYNKFTYLYNRYSNLREEYNVRFDKNWKYTLDPNRVTGIQDVKYVPSVEDRQKLINRISEKILNSPQIPRYYRKSETKQEAIKRLRNV